MTINRRTFFAGAAAFGGAPFVRAWAADEKPLWTAGLMTDTHVGQTPESCALVRRACELFAAKGVDLVVNTGDIADHHYPGGYRALRKIYDTVFAARRPQEIWVYAHHDHIDRLDEPFEKVMGDVRRLLGVPHDLYATIDFKGWPLVVFPQRIDLKRAEAMLAAVDADPRYAGRPIMVFDHVPPLSTTDNSVTWGQLARRELYSKFPRVVDFCGHSHGSLRSELNIWQGAFSAVGLGCLQVWDGHAVGGAPKNKRAYGVVLMEVYANRLVLRRFDVRDGSEYHAEAPWTIPLPFDPATAPYRRDRTARTEPVPQFAAGAALAVTCKGTPCTGVEVRFPRAEAPDGVYIYRLEIADGKGTKLARQDEFGQFWLPPKDRVPELTYALSAGYFEAGRTYRVIVTPVNCFGVCGRPLTAAFTAAAAAGTTVWESRDPMRECPFLTGLADGRPVEQKDGWFLVKGGNNRLEFPPEAWEGAAKTRFRFTVDMEMEQTAEKTWTLVLRNPEPLKNANARIATPTGASGRQRYVIEFAKQGPDCRYYLLVREGGAGRIRFSHARIERL